MNTQTNPAEILQQCKLAADELKGISLLMPNQRFLAEAFADECESFDASKNLDYAYLLIKACEYFKSYPDHVADLYYNEWLGFERGGDFITYMIEHFSKAYFRAGSYSQKLYPLD